VLAVVNVGGVLSLVVCVLGMAGFKTGSLPPYNQTTARRDNMAFQITDKVFLFSFFLLRSAPRLQAAAEWAVITVKPQASQLAS